MATQINTKLFEADVIVRIGELREEYFPGAAAQSNDVGPALWAAAVAHVELELLEARLAAARTRLTRATARLEDLAGQITRRSPILLMRDDGGPDPAQ